MWHVCMSVLACPLYNWQLVLEIAVRCGDVAESDKALSTSVMLDAAAAADYARGAAMMCSPLLQVCSVVSWVSFFLGVCGVSQQEK